MNKQGLIEKVANVQPSPVHHHILVGELHAKSIAELCAIYYEKLAIEAVMKLPARGDMRRMAIQSIREVFKDEQV